MMVFRLSCFIYQNQDVTLENIPIRILFIAIGNGLTPGPEVIKHFSTQLIMKFKLLINTEIAKFNGNLRCYSQKPVIYPVKAL